MHEFWDVERYVRNFESGLKVSWEMFTSGKPISHIYITEAKENLNTAKVVSLRDVYGLSWCNYGFL